MARDSLHVDPRGARDVARHYIRDLVYGANDGIITTFAVVSGVAGGDLSHLAVIVIGAANLAADGVSMGVGNLLAIRADEQARAAANLPSKSDTRGSMDWPRCSRSSSPEQSRSRPTCSA